MYFRRTLGITTGQRDDAPLRTATYIADVILTPCVPQLNHSVVATNNTDVFLIGPYPFLGCVPA